MTYISVLLMGLTGSLIVNHITATVPADISFFTSNIILSIIGSMIVISVMIKASMRYLR